MRLALLCTLLLASAARAEVPVQHYATGQLPAPRDVRPTEQWRVGGFEDDFLLGVIVAALVDEDGNVYLLDSQLSEVQVFDAEGNHVRTIGRAGEGPGEFQRAGGMFWVDGNLCVVQRFPGRLVMFTKDGDPAGDLTVEGVQGMGGVQVAQVQGGHRVFAKASGRRTDHGFAMVQSLGVYDQTGAELTQLASAEMEFNPGASSVREDDMVSFENNWVLFPDGVVALGRDADQYRLAFLGPDGAERVVTTVDYTALARTKEELNEIQSQPRFMMRGRGGNGGPEFIARENHPVFSELRLGPDRQLWVLSARGARPAAKGVLGQYDVFASDGKLVDRVAVRAEGSLTDDAAFFAPGHMVVIRGYRDALRAFTASFGASEDAEEAELGEPEPLEVVVYRL